MSIHARQRSVLALGFLLASCAAPGPTPGQSGPALNGESSPPEVSVLVVDSLRLSLSLVGGSPAPGDPITLELTARNEGSDEVVVNFPNGQRYDFQVFAEDGTSVWHWSDDMMFTMALGQEAIAPGQALQWRETLAEGLPSGSYRVVGTLAAMDRATVELSLEVKG